MNHKPGEHPLADILFHRTETYGAEADIYIRAIRHHIGVDATFAWWEAEVGLRADADLAFQKAGEKLDELQDAERRKTAVPEIYRMADYPKKSGET